ncbi:MAG: 6-phosphogluconolactonase [Candidatus Moranbacteria bacterium]|nr:6-phosphogluconolactonase [Candidatus Moranbacteria bacterium]
MKIEECNSKDVTIQKAAQDVTKIINEETQRPMLLLCAGGSVLEMLESVVVGENMEHVTVTILDERFEKGNPEINNFAQLSKTGFYKKLQQSRGKTIDLQIKEHESMQEYTDRFEKSLHQWGEQYSYGLIAAVVGIGHDGHIAGIFSQPYEARDPQWFHAMFDNPEKWVVGYRVPHTENQFTKRVSVTLSFLRVHVKQVVAYAVGAHKEDAIKKLLIEPSVLCDAPARILNEMTDVTLYTDATIDQTVAQDSNII